MKREILFRGKRIDNGEWVYGYVYKDALIGCNILQTKPRLAAIIVDPPTVGQYTGLKDKNGKKIFEGDIVTGLFNHTDIIGHIVYGSDATFFIERKGLYGIGLNNAEDWLEVIGNIHEEEK